MNSETLGAPQVCPQGMGRYGEEGALGSHGRSWRTGGYRRSKRQGTRLMAGTGEVRGREEVWGRRLAESGYREEVNWSGGGQGPGGAVAERGLGGENGRGEAGWVGPEQPGLDQEETDPRDFL